MIATVLLASRDTAMMYYGDEIGMVTTPPTRKAGREGSDWHHRLAEREGPRRRAHTHAMEWRTRRRFFNARRENMAAHSTQLKDLNVAAEEREPDSLLDWYRQIIALKKHDPALHEGEEIMLNTSDDHVLTWVRKAPDGEAVVVVCNFTADPRTVKLSAQGIQGSHVKTLMKSPGAVDPPTLDSVQLGPYGVYIGQVSQQ